MVKIVLTKKLFYSIIILFGILFIGVGVYAYNYSPSNPSVMGHTMNELTAPTGTGMLIFSGGTWISTTNLPTACEGWTFIQYDSTTRTFSCGSYLY